MSIPFGNLFTYEYIDGDSSVVGGLIEYYNVTLLSNFYDVPRGTWIQSVYLDTTKGAITFQINDIQKIYSLPSFFP